MRTVALNLAFLGAAGLALATCREPEGLSELTHSLPGQRLIEPRLIGSPHAPCRLQPEEGDPIPEARCSPPLAKRDAAALRDTLRRSYQRALSPMRHHTQGIAWLLLGEIDRAVSVLREAETKSPRDPRMQSDLAAALIVRAQRHNDVADLLAALEATDRALALAPRLAEARFNRALVLELLHLTMGARRAWQQALDTDRGSPWSAEITSRLDSAENFHSCSQEQEALLRAAEQSNDAQLAKQVNACRQTARELAERVLLGNWGAAFLSGDRLAATRALQSARGIGEALAQSHGDHLIALAVATIDSAAADPERLKLLAEGHRAYRDGYRQYRQRLVKEARPRIDRAREALRRSHSLFAAQAEMQQANLLYFERRYDQASAALTNLAEPLDARETPALLGQVFWMKALIEAVTGHQMGALRTVGRSAAAFEAAGESRTASLRVQGMKAEILGQLGEKVEAWKSLHSALRAAWVLGDPDSLDYAARLAATRALEDDRPKLALAFQDEAVFQALRSDDLSAPVDTLLWRSLIQTRLQHSTSAQRDLDRARRHLAARLEAGSPLRQRLSADLDRAEADQVQRTKPTLALQRLTRALRVYQADRHHLLALRTLLARARLYRRQGEAAPAEADLRAAIGLYERLGDGLSGAELLFAYFTETQGLFDEMIDFLLREKRDPAEAFAYADRAQTRVLPAGAPAETPTATLASVSARLPRGVVLIQSSVLPDRLVLWVIRASGSRHLVLPLGEEELAQRVRRLRQDLLRARDEKAALQAVDELSAALLHLLSPELATARRLIWVPDKALHSLPLSALRHPVTGRFLFQEMPVSVAASATLYLRALALRPQGGDLPLLTVGNPTFDTQLFPSLPSLPHAAQEMQAAARRITGARCLLREAAQRGTFCTLAPRARQIYFAGHALLNPQNPLLSGLVFAPAGPEETGLLYAREIAELRLPHTQLVILAACNTGKTVDRWGLASLSRAFQAAGVPTVVASLWSVDDSATTALLQSFQSHLEAHGDAAVALQEAQRELLAGRGSPTTWAAFSLFGA